MKNHLNRTFITVLTTVFVLSLASCKKNEQPIVYELGTFPDTVLALVDLNSAYDDYNVTYYELAEIIPLIFSSNRGSSGGQFDLVQGALAYSFDRITGSFTLMTGISTDPFFADLISSANTPGNDFGPYRFYSDLDGLEYMILSSAGENGDLEFSYLWHSPYFGTSIPYVNGPYPVTLLNSVADEAYICFDTNQDSAYFSSNSDGQFDIYLHTKPEQMLFTDWLAGDFEPSEKAEILNSTSDDKCPYIYRKTLVFASDREGGLGGFDLYYSILSGGQWSEPTNMGPDVNTAFDEYRPVLGGNVDFTNMMLLFSSNRPGGKGGFDLYYYGLTLNE